MISTTTNRVTYVGDGTSALFAFQYEFHADADLGVAIWNSARLIVGVAKTLNVDYTISGTKDAQNRYTNGANVIFNSTPAVGDIVVVYRNTALTQPFGLKFGQTIPNEEMTKALDRLAIIEQRLNDLTGRSIRLNDSFPLTMDTRLPDQLPKNAPIIVNSAGIGVDIGVVAFNGTTAATYFGILPVPNGGTGLDWSILTGIPYSPGNNNVVFSRIQNGPEGWILSSHGSSAPTFDAFAATQLNSGIVRVDVGGTGTGTSYTAYGVVFASSATQFTNTAAGGTDQPLMGNTGAGPSFKPLNVASNSSVTGILKQSNGGTGSASSFQQYSVLYQDSATTLAAATPAASGTALIANASAAPTFQAIAVTPVTPTTLTANATLTNAISNVILNSSNYTVQMYDCSGNAGREVDLFRVNNQFENPITITCSGAQSFIGIGTTIAFHTIGQCGKLFTDGANWYLKQSRTDTEAIVFTCSSTWSDNITHSATLSRSGKFAKLTYRTLCTGQPGEGGSDGDLKYGFPNGIILDKNQLPAFTVISNSTTTYLDGFTAIYDDSSATVELQGGIPGVCAYSGTTKFIPLCMDIQAATNNINYFIDRASPIAFTGSDFICSQVIIPVVGWLP